MSEKENNNQDLQDLKEQPSGAAQPEPAPEKSEACLLREELAQCKDKMLRSYAELENVKKRTQREKDMIYPEAVASTVEKFLPAMDNFERALAQDGGGDEFRRGVEMIYSSLLDAMKTLSAESFGEAGEQFDPAIHNAVSHVEDENRKEKEIVEVYQKGYRIGGRIIRFAMVRVAN